MIRDARDVPVSAASAKSLAGYETALVQFQTYVGDPLATLDATLAEDPDFVAGHLFKALAIFTTSEKQLMPAAAEAFAQATRRMGRANERERMLASAARRYLDGDWHAGCRELDRVLVDYPRDAMALQVAHLMDFYLGDALNLRNRVSRVLPHWDASVPGYSYVLGMHAFGLEEMNQYAEAEAAGRRALELQPKDGWAVHAVTHVMEMQGRIDDGIEWLQSRQADWAPDNGFAFHNWWHLALFHMDAGRFDRALALYDEAIHPQPAQVVLALVDATALLWRLWLEGVDVGRRFEAVAEEWQSRQQSDTGFYAFNDFHASLAFAATGRSGALANELASLQSAAAQPGTNGMMSREVALPLCKGVEAFARGDYAGALALLEPARDAANRFGGSHAQRDLLSLTIIEAALRGAQPALARHYLAERLVHKPASQWAARLGRRLAPRDALAKAA